MNGRSQDLYGWIYITELLDVINVYPLSLNNNSIVNFQPGTNIFFQLESSSYSSMRVPVARNVAIGKTTTLKGYVGLPDNAGIKFFDDSSIKK